MDGLSVVVLTGPAASGKNTVARAIAERLPSLAIVDVDAVRWMVVKPHIAPWAGAEGRRQHELGVRNACALAREFVRAGFPTIVLDVLIDPIAAVYREMLRDVETRIVQLLPDWPVLEARFVDRARTVPSATIDEAKLVYQWQLDLKNFDDRIDSTSMSIEDVVDLLVPLFVDGPGP